MLTPYNWSNFSNSYRTVISPFGGQFIRIKFKCIRNECESWVYPEDFEIPEPRYAAENSRESESEVDSAVSCPNCDELYEITLSNSFGGTDIYIPDIENEDIYYEEIDEELEALLNTTNYYELFEQNIRQIEEYVEQNRDDNYLNNLLLLSCIASMESYLSTALIKFIEGNEKRYKLASKVLKRFDLNNHIESVFEKDLDTIKSSILGTIAGETFHNHKKIKSYYEGILGIELDYDFSAFGKIIQRRHDIVHRNCRTREGTILQLDNEQLENDISEIQTFINYINHQLPAI